MSRIPPGHPEGYLEGFATIYSEAAEAIMAAKAGTKPDPAVTYPTVDDGLAGMAFITACVRSSGQGRDMDGRRTRVTLRSDRTIGCRIPQPPSC